MPLIVFGVGSSSNGEHPPRLLGGVGQFTCTNVSKRLFPARTGRKEGGRREGVNGASVQKKDLEKKRLRRDDVARSARKINT